MAPTSLRRLGAAGLAALLGLVGAAGAATATPAFELRRVAGTDRYLTASSVAADAFTSATDAVIARGDGTAQQFADALAGSYLAGTVGGGGPLLLTVRDSLPSATRTRLLALGVDNVHLLGGTSAVSASVEAELAEDFTVTRVQGVDRYETAAEIATTPAAAAIGQVDGKRTALLATGVEAADALAAGPLAYAERLPILLTQPNLLPASTSAALDELQIAHVVVLGGTSAVSTAVETQVKAKGITTERVQGISRYETAAEVADFALGHFTDWADDAVDVANGLNPADALAGGPAAGEAQRPIVLTLPLSLPNPTRDWLAGASSTLTNGRIFGGTSAISTSVEEAAETAGRGDSDTASGTVVVVDKANDTYSYVPTGADTAIEIDYEATDNFFVGNQSATLGGFETALTVADGITVTVGTSNSTHRLTNQAPPTSGTIGNVDLADDEFDIIDEPSGYALNPDISYVPTDASYSIDGTSGQTLPQFEGDLNEGDTVETSGTSFSLTNVTVNGLANAIEKPALPIQTTTRLMIDKLGDDPATSSDGGADSAGNDDKYEADGGSSGDEFVVEGVAAEYEDFNEQLSEGDRVTYARVGSVETFTLSNLAPATETGQATSAHDPEGDGNPLTGDESDGGTFTLATAEGAEEITYTSGGTWVLDGAVATEAEVEAAYSAGDEISFRPADGPTGTAQRFQLTTANLAGAVDPESVNIEDSEVDGKPANSYAVLARNGTTELATVVYDDDDTYLINGNTVNQAAFETELTAIKDGSRAGSAEVVVDGTVQQHRLTTSATS